MKEWWRAKYYLRHFHDRNFSWKHEMAAAPRSLLCGDISKASEKIATGNPRRARSWQSDTHESLKKYSCVWNQDADLNVNIFFWIYGVCIPLKNGLVTFWRLQKLTIHILCQILRLPFAKILNGTFNIHSQYIQYCCICPFSITNLFTISTL